MDLAIKSDRSGGHLHPCLPSKLIPLRIAILHMYNLGKQVKSCERDAADGVHDSDMFLYINPSTSHFYFYHHLVRF